MTNIGEGDGWYLLNCQGPTDRDREPKGRLIHQGVCNTPMQQGRPIGATSAGGGGLDPGSAPCCDRHHCTLYRLLMVSTPSHPARLLQGGPPKYPKPTQIEGGYAWSLWGEYRPDTCRHCPLLAWGTGPPREIPLTLSLLSIENASPFLAPHPTLPMPLWAKRASRTSRSNRVIDRAFGPSDRSAICLDRARPAHPFVTVAGFIPRLTTYRGEDPRF